MRPRRGARARRFALAPWLIVAFVAFVALGTWQLQRRVWKLDLIERVERRVHAVPVDAPAADGSGVDAAHDEYRHVRVTGRFIADADTRVQALSELGAGFWVLTPLRRDDGSVVLVNRGFVATGAADAPPPPGTVTLTGLLRLSEPGGGFLRRNDPPANRWYSRDVAAIAAQRGLTRVAPFFIDADATPARSRPGRDDVPNPEPIGGLTVIAFHNNHLVYALTWFALALMSAWAAWRVVREPPGG